MTGLLHRNEESDVSSSRRYVSSPDFRALPSYSTDFVVKHSQCFEKTRTPDLTMNHAQCLSAEPHEDNIKEVLLHFLGCLPFSERHDFLYGEHPVWTFEAKHNQGGLTQKRDKWRESCLNELRRIEFLRETLKYDKDEYQLVADLDTSREEWRKSTEYDRGMELVKQWKQSIPQYTQAYKPSGTEVTVNLKTIEDEYILERDVNVPIIKFKGGEAQDFESKNDDKMVWGRFPDQKTTVEHLLDKQKGKDNILYREKADPSTIKYFHLPSNNMTVSRSLHDAFPPHQQHRLTFVFLLVGGGT